MSPEAIGGFAGKEADMWSLGVLLYTLVSGHMPFSEKSKRKLFERIENCDWEFVSPAFDNVTSNCKDLISKLIV